MYVNKKRKLQHLQSPLSRISCNFAFLSDMLFPLLSLCDHFRLGRTSKSLMASAGIPVPSSRSFIERPEAWNKLVTIPSCATQSQLQHLFSFAAFTRIIFPCIFRGEALTFLRPARLQYLDLSYCGIQRVGLSHIMKSQLQHLILQHLLANW